MTNQAVFGILANRAKAEKVIQTLVDAGVDPQDISILSSQGEEFRELENKAKTMESTRNWRTEERVPNDRTGKPTQEPLQTPTNHTNKIEKHTRAPEGATAGLATGGIIGGVLGLLAGIGALAIPGIGPFIAAGPLMATLSGIGAGGTLGGIIGALAGLGIPEFEAKHYMNRLKQGGILISIRAKNVDVAKHWKDLLKKEGAEEITISSEDSLYKLYNKK
jgi:hypothetical protein